MNFIGKICPYCKTEFKEGDDVVVCSVCEMPHHKDCWIENKACTTFGCTGTIVGTEQYTEAANKKAFCSKCGTQLNEGQKFCSSCGTPADVTGESHFQAAGATAVNQSYRQNAYFAPPSQYSPQYFAPQYNVGYNPYGQQQADPDMYTFIQSNQLFYIIQFQKMQMNNSKTSWNWCSFLFNGYWLAYRKMYGIAAAYFGIYLVLGLIPGLGYALQLAMAICVGIFGNYFYMQHVSQELQTAKSMDTMNKSAYIAKKGGTNIGAIFAVAGIVFVLLIIIYSVIFY